MNDRPYVFPVVSPGENTPPPDLIIVAVMNHHLPQAIKDMIRTLWWKFMIDVGINQASAVLRAPYGVFQSLPEAGDLMESAMKEVILLAERQNIDLSEKDIQEWLAFLSSLAPTGKTSMLQDVEGGRKTEVEIFSEKVVSLGKDCGVPTPVNETLSRILKLTEQRLMRGE